MKGGKFLYVFVGEGYINCLWFEWEKEKDKGVNYEKNDKLVNFLWFVWNFV